MADPTRDQFNAAAQKVAATAPAGLSRDAFYALVRQELDRSATPPPSSSSSADSPDAPQTGGLPMLALLARAGVQPAATAVADFATSPTAWSTSKDVGQIIGAILGALVDKGNPILGAAGGMWGGGKAGYRLSNLAQKVAAPVASGMEAATPAIQTAASALGGAVGLGDLAQMDMPTRQDIGTFGIGASSPAADPQHPALINALINLLMQKQPPVQP